MTLRQLFFAQLTTCLMLFMADLRGAYEVYSPGYIGGTVDWRYPHSVGRINWQWTYCGRWDPGVCICFRSLPRDYCDVHAWIGIDGMGLGVCDERWAWE